MRSAADRMDDQEPTSRTPPLDHARGALVEDKLLLDKAVRSFSMRHTGIAVSPDASAVVELPGGERYAVLRNESGSLVATYRRRADGAVTPEENPPTGVVRALSG